MSTEASIFEGTGQTSPNFYHAIPDRDTFVTAEYMGRAHKNTDLNAEVHYRGEPIEQNDERLLVGMVPIERRWCIGPAENGVAELMDERDFHGEYQTWYDHSYAFHGQSPDDASKAHIPHPKAWVSMKVNPSNPRKLLPLGMHPPGVKPKFDPKRDGTHTYDPELDDFVSAKPVRDERDERIAELERQLAAIQAKEGAEAAAAVEDTAKCGKKVRPGYVNQHEAKCGTCKEEKKGDTAK